MACVPSEVLLAVVMRAVLIQASYLGRAANEPEPWHVAELLCFVLKSMVLFLSPASARMLNGYICRSLPG